MSTERAGPATPFHALEQRRAFQQIILQIEQAIRAGQLNPGDRLPSERELAETFGVSRPSVREAMRVLEMFGVLTARRGAGPESGSIVSASAESGLVSALAFHTALGRIPTQDVVEVRRVLESHTVRRAAAAAAAESAGELRRIIGRMQDASTLDEYHQLDTDFHIALARASGNALVPVLMEALRESISREMLSGFAGLPDWKAESQHLVAEHAAIVDAIEEGDADAAEAQVRQHIDGFYRKAMESR